MVDAPCALTRVWSVVFIGKCWWRKRRLNTEPMKYILTYHCIINYTHSKTTMHRHTDLFFGSTHSTTTHITSILEPVHGNQWPSLTPTSSPANSGSRFHSQRRLAPDETVAMQVYFELSLFRACSGHPRFSWRPAVGMAKIGEELEYIGIKDIHLSVKHQCWMAMIS